nr:MAG TPA: hypothetical protein [Caudoviricetes sp.]
MRRAQRCRFGGAARLAKSSDGRGFYQDCIQIRERQRR